MSEFSVEWATRKISKLLELEGGSSLKNILIVLILLNAFCLQASEKLLITALHVNELINKSKLNSPWVAEDNNLFEEYFADGGDSRFGLTIKRKVFTKRKQVNSKRENIPTRIDWRNFAGQDWISPVKHQRKCGSCVAFSAAGVVEAHYNIKSRVFNYDLDLSEQHLFTCGGGSCKSGWFPTTGLHYMKLNGTSDESCAPYKIGNNREDLACSTACPDVNSRLFKIKDYLPVGGSWSGSTIQDIKEWLLDGPVTASMEVYEDFMLYKSGVYTRVTGKLLGGHSVVVVGYDEEEEFFIVKNSWGEDWGENGYFRISYNADTLFGALSYQPVLNDIKGTIKLSTPKYRDILSDNVVIEASTNISGLLNIEAVVLVHKSPNKLASLPLNSFLRGEFDSRVFNDGTYDIYVKGEKPSGEVVRSDYKTFYVLNGEPTVSVSFMKQFDGDRLPDFPEFELKCENQTVELTKYQFFIKGPGLDRKITKPYPCPMQMIKLSSKEYKKGQYVVFAKAYIGETEVAIKNSFKLIKE
jgi:hypothetical protein